MPKYVLEIAKITLETTIQMHNRNRANRGWKNVKKIARSDTLETAHNNKK